MKRALHMIKTKAQIIFMFKDQIKQSSISESTHLGACQIDSLEDITVCQHFCWSKASTLRGHLDSVNSACWVPGGLISVSDDCLVRGWFQNKMSFSIRQHKKPLLSVLCLQNTFYSCGLEGLLSVYGINECLYPFQQTASLQTVQIGEPLFDLFGQKKNIILLAQTKFIALKSGQTPWDSINQNLAIKLESVPVSGLWNKGTPLISDINGGLFTIDLQKHRIGKHLRKDKQAVVNSLDGEEVIVTGSSDGLLGLYDIRVGKCVSSLLAHKEGVDAVSYHPAQSLATTGSGTGSMRIWQLRRLKCLSESICHRSKWERGVCKLVQHPSKNVLVSCGADGKINIFTENL